jgi:hypothetical protein
VCRYIFLKEKPVADPHPGYRQDIEAPVNEDDRPRDIFITVDQNDINDDQQGAHAHGLDDAEQVADAGEPPHAAIDVEYKEADKLDQDGNRQNRHHLIGKFFGNGKIEPYQVGRKPGKAQEAGVDAQKDEEIAVEERFLLPQFYEFG